ncbi:5-oxoprolinase [Leucoagaricus sp. SymC.cos]|nr:5-oxoprolinase [Leucoagaricus sp. SymC.cos]
MQDPNDIVWKLGVDVGGTFTDAVLYNKNTGETYKAKVPSTPQDQSQGVLNAINTLRQAKTSYIQIARTTVATNAVLEGKGATVALLVTEGYKDILQVRRSHVPGGLAGWITWPKPEPLAPLELTIEVPGRVSSSGEIIRPFNADLLLTRLSKLKTSNLKPESITISLINSFANPIHEHQVAQIVRSEFPDIPISLSSDVLPEIMEYERTVTTVANAYVKPVVHRYLANLEKRLKGTDVKVLRSDGGLSSASVAKDHCASLLYSGPAGGVAGVVTQVARTTRFKNLLTFDMGGTSTDVCLIEDGKPGLRRESTVGDLNIRAPSVDVRTVGAGGGSIASVAEMTGALRVGPESAGAVPGPACYSMGGTKPTVTDAFAVLGYLPSALLGGSFHLDVDAAYKSIEENVVKPMKLSGVVEAAEGIIRITLERMYGSLRSVSVEKGKDPRDYHLVSFGGAGGLVACDLAKLCGVKYPLIIPPSPGVLCAFGDACTGVRHETSTTMIRNLKDIDLNEFRAACERLHTQVSNVLLEQGIKDFTSAYEVDLQYRGQATNLPVGFEMQELLENSFSVLRKRFEDNHVSLFTFSLDLDVEMVNLRAVAQENVKGIKIQSVPEGNGVPIQEALQSTTSLYYGGRKYENVPIFDRARLRLGDMLSGPCIVTETDSTTFVTPGHRAEIDDVANILIWPRAEGSILCPDKLSSQAFDPIIVQLVEAGLQNIRVEMDTLIQRVAMSPAMREQLDYFPMIAAGDGPHSGKMVCGQFGSFIPGFLASWDETIEEGDVFLTNDPYSCSNAISHLNDFLVVTPVHYQGKIVAWTANLGHFTDIGSSVPGSMPNCASSIYEDGTQIPLCKLYSRNVPNTAVFKIVERNSRKFDFAKSDLRALVAATRVAAKRIIEICERFGVEAYEKALDTLLTRNRLAVGKIIRNTVSAEKVHFEDYIDDDGFGVGPWKVAGTMWKELNKEGDEVIILDFDGTDPQSDRSINFALSHEMLKMFVVFYLLTVFDPSTIVNDGSFDLIEVKVPEGTLLNPIRPAALSCRTHLLGRVFDTLGALFGQRTPEFLSAGGYSDSPHFFFSGWNKAGEWFQLYQIGFGGIPSRPLGDGPDGHSMWPSMRSVPNEFLESYLPLRVDRYETVPDSGGEGFYRGGNAMRIDYAFLDSGNISIHDDRWYTKPWGVNGGGVGARSTKTLVRYSVDQENPPRQVLQSKEDFIRVDAGDVLEWVTWGGNGDPLQRDPVLVAKEVRRGLVKDPARYGVCLTAAGEVDMQATLSLRASMKPRQEQLCEEVFNRGEPMKELRQRCLEETGLPPPKLPSERVLRGPITKIPYINELQARRKREDALLYD